METPTAAEKAPVRGGGETVALEASVPVHGPSFTASLPASKGNGLRNLTLAQGHFLCPVHSALESPCLFR